MTAARFIPIYTESRSVYWFRHLLGRIAKRIRRRRENAENPRLVTFPNDVIGREIAVAGIYERAGIEAIRYIVRSGICDADAPGSIFLDVGANIGVYSTSVCRLFDRVVCIEPNPLTARILELNLEINGVGNAEIIRIALSDSAGEAFLEIPSADNLGGARISTTRGDRIAVGRADDVLENSCANGRLVFVKIDIEGHEGPAIEGMSRIIASHHPIIAFEANSSGSDAVREHLLKAGYVRFLALAQRPVTRNWFVNVACATLFGARSGLHDIERIGKSQYSLVFALTKHHANGLDAYEARSR